MVGVINGQRQRIREYLRSFIKIKAVFYAIRTIFRLIPYDPAFNHLVLAGLRFGPATHFFH